MVLERVGQTATRFRYFGIQKIRNRECHTVGVIAALGCLSLKSLAAKFEFSSLAPLGVTGDRKAVGEGVEYGKRSA